MPSIKTRDGAELYVKDWGEGRPVIMIHGWPLSADMWGYQAMRLAEAGYRTIAYDRRGFGRSSQPWAGYDYDTLADDLGAVIEATGAADATLVGFSMGGGEVARYLSRRGGAGVAGAALIASVVPGLLKSESNPSGVEAAALDEMKEGILRDRPNFIKTWAQNYYGVGWVTSPVSEERVQWAVAIGMQSSLKAMLACVDAFGTTDFTPDLAAFTMPTLIVHGTSDAIVPIDATSRRAAAAIPGARLIEYEGATHGVCETERERLAQDLLDFLAA
ncbi:MAG: alpha/beta hydrolase [Sphingomonadaceae bacterium]|nr:alpha/beta hydrolase [Sphingomonadaceae bacterium]